MHANTLPTWPFAILAVLLALGYWQSHSRIVKPGMLVKVAVAMLIVSLYGVTATFGLHAVPVLAWAVGFVACALLGGRFFAPRGLAREGDAVRMPGSWVPMGLMLGIFMTRFGLGFATGVHARVLQDAWFVATACMALGVLSGAFATRATAVHRFNRVARAA